MSGVTRRSVAVAVFASGVFILSRAEESVTLTDPLPLGLFELDGNVTTGVLGTSGSTTTSHDWDQVFAGNAGGAVASTFVTDAVNSVSDDIFTGGGSKDTVGIHQGPWWFTNGKPQAKDDIREAFAASYTDPGTGDVILLAGLDRYDNSGDSTVGFWFLKSVIGEDPITAGHPFTGQHEDGDILFLSDFTIGGSVSTVHVYRWTGDDSTGALVAVTVPANTTFAIVNGASIAVPWPFIDKSGNTGPAAGEFMEEGVNLSALGLGGCFSSFLADTRSSLSTTATLADFVIGSFSTNPAVVGPTLAVSGGSTASVTWGAIAGVTAYDTYRGSRNAGSGFSFNETCFENGDALGDGTTTSTDAGVPGLGGLYYYLVSSRNQCGEGSLGTQSSGAPRPNPFPCP